MEILRSNILAIEEGYFARFMTELTSETLSSAQESTKFIDLSKSENSVRFYSVSEQVSGAENEPDVSLSLIPTDRLAAYDSTSKKSKEIKPEVIAIVPIKGVMQKRWSYFGQSSNTVACIDYLRMLDEDPNVKGVILDIDSPGGTVSGTYELGKAVKKFSKPIVAYANDLVASAAMWVASQADEIWASSPTATLGSIDVLSIHDDYSEMFASVGIKRTYITSDTSGDKVVGNPTTPLTDESYNKIRNELAEVKKVFQKNVSDGRGERLSATDRTFSGATYYTAEAKSMGLVDGMGDIDKVAKRVNTLYRKKKKEKSEAVASDSITLPNHSTTVKMGIFDKWIGTPKAEEDVILKASEANVLNETLERLEAENADLVEKVSQLSGSLEQADEKASSLSASNEQLTEKLASMEQNMSKAKENSEASEQLVSKVSDLEATVETLNSDLEEANSKVAELTATIESLNSAKVELETRVSETTSAYNELAKEAAKESREASPVVSSESEAKEEEKENAPELSFRRSRSIRSIGKAISIGSIRK